MTQTAPYPGAPAATLEAAQRDFPLRRPRWGIPDAAITLIATIVASVAFGLAVSGSATLSAGLLLLALIIQWLPMAGWPLLVTRWRGNGPGLDLGLRLTRADLGWGVLGGALSLVGSALAAGLTVAIFGEFDSAAGELGEDLSGQRLALVVLFLAVAFVGPVVEEICFRGLFWSSLRKYGLGGWWCTALTAAAFALFHFELVRIPILLVVGLVLGWVRQRTAGLGAPIIAHMVNNIPGAIFILTI